MKRIELYKSVEVEQMQSLLSAGLVSDKYPRYVYIYDCVQALLAEGVCKMDAYMRVGIKCYTHEDNVRKIVRFMEEEVEGAELPISGLKD